MNRMPSDSHGAQHDTYARFGRYQADEAEFIDGTPPRIDGSYPTQSANDERAAAVAKLVDLAYWIAGLGLLAFLVRGCLEWSR